jgi:hypothetical protein
MHTQGTTAGAMRAEIRARTPRAAPSAAAVAALLAALACAGCLPATLSDAELDEKIGAASFAKSCAAQVDCRLAEGCAGNADCEADCVADAGADTLAAVDALVGCYQGCVDNVCAALKGVPLEGCKRRCLTTRCANENLACSDTSGEGEGVCIDVLGCIDACPVPGVGDTAQCAAACVRGLSPAAYTLAASFSSCQATALAAGKNPGETCITQLAACYAAGATGASACYEAFACQETCVADGTAENECLQSCFPELSVTAQADYLLYLLCLGDKDGDLSACKSQLVDCANPSGKANCKSLFDKVQACVKKKGTNSSGSCVAETLHDGAPGAALPFVDMLLCWSTHCVSPCNAQGPACATCLSTKCGKQYATCSTQ